MRFLDFGIRAFFMNPIRTIAFALTVAPARILSRSTLNFTVQRKVKMVDCDKSGAN